MKLGSDIQVNVYRSWPVSTNSDASHDILVLDQCTKAFGQLAGQFPLQP
jgi:hypothetical protein